MFKLVILFSLSLAILCFVMSVQDTPLHLLLHICWNLMMVCHLLKACVLFMFWVYQPVHIIMLLPNTKAYMILYGMYAFVQVVFCSIVHIPKRNKYSHEHTDIYTQPVEYESKWHLFSRLVIMLSSRKIWQLTIWHR